MHEVNVYKMNMRTQIIENKNQPMSRNPFSTRKEQDSISLKLQLEREISCLVKQLDRLKYMEGYHDTATVRTYEEMISARRDMLGELR